MSLNQEEEITTSITTEHAKQLLLQKTLNIEKEQKEAKIKQAQKNQISAKKSVQHEVDTIKSKTVVEHSVDETRRRAMVSNLISDVAAGKDDPLRDVVKILNEFLSKSLFFKLIVLRPFKFIVLRPFKFIVLRPFSSLLSFDFFYKYYKYLFSNILYFFSFFIIF